MNAEIQENQENIQDLDPIEEVTVDHIKLGDNKSSIFKFFKILKYLLI